MLDRAVNKLSCRFLLYLRLFLSEVFRASQLWKSAKHKNDQHSGRTWSLLLWLPGCQSLFGIDWGVRYILFLGTVEIRTRFLSGIDMWSVDLKLNCKIFMMDILWGFAKVKRLYLYEAFYLYLFISHVIINKLLLPAIIIYSKGNLALEKV